MFGKVIKYIILLALLGALLFGILNFDYLTKLMGYGINQSFLTDAQRQDIQNEHPIKVEPDQLVIPTLNVVAPIQYPAKASDSDNEVSLAKGVVHYPGSADVGEAGNVYIFGHSSDFVFSKGDYKTVFALLPQIQIGAEILISDHDGTQFKYKVLETKVVEKTDTSVLSQDTNGRSYLTLQTSYPVGTALQRFVVKAELEYNQ